MSNYTQLVQDLNLILFEEFHMDKAAFEYRTDGFSDAIYFEDVLLWYSEEDSREYNEELDEYEPLESYIRKMFNKYVEELNKIRL